MAKMKICFGVKKFYLFAVATSVLSVSHWSVNFSTLKDHPRKHQKANHSAFVLNEATWHSEVVYSMMLLCSQVYVRRLYVLDKSLKVKSFIAENDPQPTMVSKPLDALLPVVNDMCRHCSERAKILLFFTTGESLGNFSRSILNLSCRWACVHIFFMCHNLEPCGNTLLHTSFHTRPIVLSSTNKLTYLLSKIQPFETITWLPLIRKSWSDDNLEPALSSRTRILVPGSVNFSKRNYDSLAYFSSRALPAISVNVFGKCGREGECERLSQLSSVLSSHQLHFEHSNRYMRGSFSSHRSMMISVRNADYIFPAIDEMVKYSKDYTDGGKLTSSVVLSLSSGTPLLLWCDLASVYNLKKQICYRSSSASDMTAAISEAVMSDQRARNSMSEELRMKARESQNDILQKLALLL